MNTEQYNRIFNYLDSQTLPSDLVTNYKIKQFQNFCKSFIIKNNFLYKVNRRKTDNLLRVIRTHELDAVLYVMHNSPTAEYFAVDKMFEKIRSRYYWPQMYENIRE